MSAVTSLPGQVHGNGPMILHLRDNSNASAYAAEGSIIKCPSSENVARKEHSSFLASTKEIDMA